MSTQVSPSRRSEQISPSALPKTSPSPNILLAVSRSLLIAGLGVGAAVVVFVAWIEPRRPVAQVRMNNGALQKIRTTEFQERLRFERERQLNRQKRENSKRRWQDRLKIDERPLYTLGFAASILDRMTREILVREEAERRGLTVTQTEIDRLIEQEKSDGLAAATSASTASSAPAASSVPVSPPPMQQAAPKDGAKVWEIAKRDLPKTYRDIVGAEILEKKLQTAFFQDVPVEQERVHLNLIRFEFEADARQVLANKSDRAAFDELYARVIRGEVSGATGMVSEWSSAGELEHDFNAALSQAAFSLKVAQHTSEPISAARGWYLVQVLGHELRTMPEAWRREHGEEKFKHWLERQQVRVTQFPIWMERTQTKWLPPEVPRMLMPPSNPRGDASAAQDSSPGQGPVGANVPSHRRHRADPVPGANSPGMPSGLPGHPQRHLPLTPMPGANR